MLASVSNSLDSWLAVFLRRKANAVRSSIWIDAILDSDGSWYVRYITYLTRVSHSNRYHFKAEKLTGRLTSNTRPSSTQDPQQHFLVRRPRTSHVQDKHEEPPELGATRPSKHGGLPTVTSTSLRQKIAFWQATSIKCTTLSLLVYWTFAVLPQLVLTAQDLYASYVAFSGLWALSFSLSLLRCLSLSLSLSLPVFHKMAERESRDHR